MENKMITLFVKVAYIFANCDEHFDDREKIAIDNYISAMQKCGAVSDFEAQKLKTLDFSSLSYNSIIEDVKFLLNQNPEEKSNILNELEIFIEEIISSDNEISPKELELFSRWKNDLSKA